MRRAFLPVLPALVAWGCDSTEPSVPAAVVLAPTELTFDAIHLRDTIVADVLDQRGNRMENVALTWSAEGSAVTIEPLGGDSAVVTSAGNGSAIVRAAVGVEIVGQAAVTVTQKPAGISPVQGLNQGRTVGNLLDVPIVVAVRDRSGAGVTGIPVAFVVTRGGGTLSIAEAVTGVSGTAEVSWTLGTSTSSGQELTVTAEGVGEAFVISATALPDSVASLTIVRGDNQSAATLGRVSIQPTVFVADRFGNGVPSVNVSFQVVQGGGTVLGGFGQTGSTGEYSVQSWALGFEAGENILRARVTNTNLAVDFRATGVAPPTIAVNAGAGQAAMANTPLPVPPTFIVRDGTLNPIPGVTVLFTVLEGGGTVTTQSAVTDASGVASPGDWIMGPIANRNRLSARAMLPGLENSSVFLDASGCGSKGGIGYEITLCFSSAMTGSQLPLFDAAAARWSEAIIGDLPNVNISSSAACPGLPSVSMSIDDLLIFVSAITIDGNGGVLAQAGPCRVRGTGLLPSVGLMRFDRIDLENMGSNSLQSVMLHEMGHVIGIGSLWDDLNLVVNPSTTTVKLDTYYSGAAGRAGFDAIGGTLYTGGQKVPVENEGGPGTMNGHWRESVFRNELMTGFINAGDNPRSLMTVRSLEDLGYTVNPAVADPYTYTPIAGLRAAEAVAEGVQMVDDILDLPLLSTDASGREVRVR